MYTLDKNTLNPDSELVGTSEYFYLSQSEHQELIDSYILVSNYLLNKYKVNSFLNIGCGFGELLGYLSGLDTPVLGMDNTLVGSRVNNKKGLTVVPLDFIMSTHLKALKTILNQEVYIFSDYTRFLSNYGYNYFIKQIEYWYKPRFIVVDFLIENYVYNDIEFLSHDYEELLAIYPHKDIVIIDKLDINRRILVLETNKV